MKMLVLLSALAGTLAATQQPTFKSSAALVRIEVSVTDDHGPVQGLRPTDFVLTDNGVVQRPSVDELKDTPLDLVAVAHPLASLRQTSEQQAPRIAAGFAAFVSNVDDRDRLALLLANAPAIRLRALTFGRPLLDQTAIEGSQYAAMFDAITAGLSEFVQTDRRQVLVAFTNAADFRSTVSFEALVQQARRLGPAFLLIGSPTQVRQSVNVSAQVRGGSELANTTAVVSGFVFPSGLQLLARRTGGITIDLGQGDPADLMKTAFTWMRTRYVLSYEPTAGKGWHPVTVRLTQRRANVSARDGYFVD